MTPRHEFVCGHGKASTSASRASCSAIALDLQGSGANVHLKLENISDAMAREVPARLIDLLELAAYVYAADQAITRGPSTDTGERWRRDFDLHVALRDPDFWSRADALEALTELLSFLSDDEYRFRFSRVRHPPPVQLYFESGGVGRPEVERVQLFSGGADSFAGAVQGALVEKRNVALVNHRSAPKRIGTVEYLLAEIARRALPRVVYPVSVWATRAESVGREYTQRTRSFLYGALATTVAAMLELDRIFFFENGVTSINLPIAGQVVGGRATRTTHPQTIEGFARLFSLVLDKTFKVESPFLWQTKTDVLRLAREAGCADLLAHTVSCSRTVGATKLHSHCGCCSQCIDRRFAALAAGLGEVEDPPEMYKVDLLTGERALGEDRAMLQGFVERARVMREADDTAFFVQFPEANRVLRHTGLATSEAARRILDIHRQHGADVGNVLAQGLKDKAEEFHAGRLPDSCLLVLAVPERYRSGPDVGQAAEGPSFMREGDFWRVEFANEAASLKNSIGMRYLALLLQSPGRDLHCAELARIGEGAVPVPGLVWKDPSPTRELGGDLPVQGGGDRSSSDQRLADRMTVRECHRRLVDLETEVTRAHADGATDRELVLKEEEGKIRNYLRVVTGFDGEPRRAYDENEKARKAVASDVRRALKHIDTKLAPLGRHLRKHLQTGMFCVYAPDPSIRWTVRP